MTESFSRREFLKISTIGAATVAAAALTGCGTAARYVKRQPYTNMPEYTLPGQSTFYATTCCECSAGCGLIIRTVEGRAIKVEGNPNHPVSRGHTCSRAQASLQGLYNPERVIGPQMQATPGAGLFGPINWDTAIGMVKDALQKNKPEEIAFLMGLTPDHLFDLVSEVATALGAAAPLRYSALGLFEARKTLARAASVVFGVERIPVFDIANADLIFSFGANFAETWLSPVAYQRGFGEMRQGHFNKRGYLVQFEARMSLTAASADEWVPIVPGTEGIVAQALARLLADSEHAADVSAAAMACGVSEERLRHLAEIFNQTNASARVALPGGLALSQPQGFENAQAILSLNLWADSALADSEYDGTAKAVTTTGQTGRVSFLLAPSIGQDSLTSSFDDVNALINRMNQGQVKALFIHGVNPIFEIPQVLGFAKALKNVPLVVSFAPFLDETAVQANYVLPDHTPFESWGYQRTTTGGDQGTLSSIQPVVVPLYDTKATADVLLAAISDSASAAIGGDLAAKLAAKIPYSDEVAYLQQAVARLAEKTFGVFGNPEGFWSGDPRLFWTEWLQHGGWWNGADSSILEGALFKGELAAPEYHGDGEFHLIAFPHPHLGDGAGANRPWLQETPDPMTTVMWDSWVEINPSTADRLGLKDDDIVQIISPVGTVEAVVYRYPAIRPDTVALPFGQGHTQLGHYAQGRGCNPLDLLSSRWNAAGDLVVGGLKVDIRPTGQTRKLARYEDRAGVYGDGKK